MSTMGIYSSDRTIGLGCCDYGWIKYLLVSHLVVLWVLGEFCGILDELSKILLLTDELSQLRRIGSLAAIDKSFLLSQ